VLIVNIKKVNPYCLQTFDGKNTPIMSINKNADVVMKKKGKGLKKPL